MLPRVLRVLIQAVQRFVSGMRWLALQAYRQRSLGVASNPQLARLLDIHFVTVAAHLALLAAMIVAEPVPSPRDWLLSLPMIAFFTAAAVWRPTRLVIGLLLAAQLLVSVVAAVWSPGGILLTMFFALAVAQQAAVTRGSGGKLGRATAAGLLLGVFTAGAGLIVGLLTPAAPLWICAVLMTIALVLSLSLPPVAERPKLPRQAGKRTAVPEGYAVYRPSSLDEKKQ